MIEQSEMISCVRLVIMNELALIRLWILAGAVVQIECRSRKTSEITYQKHGVTDSTGSYKIPVRGDRGDDRCDVLLVKSSDPECSMPNSGRDRARVILTRNNGMNSNIRFANSMGFLKNAPLARCAEVLQKYQDTEEDVWRSWVILFELYCIRMRNLIQLYNQIMS